MPGMTLDESARRLGALAWVEQRLFETLGSWVRVTSDAGSALVLSSTARHHGAHALDLVRLLPETRDHDPAAFVSPPPDLQDRWAAVAEADGPVAGFPPLATALAGHLAALEAWLDDASPVRDGPGIRVVGSVLAEDRRDSDRLLARAP